MHVYTGIVVSLVCELTVHNYCKVVYVIVSHSCLTSQYVFVLEEITYTVRRKKTTNLGDEVLEMRV